MTADGRRWRRAAVAAGAGLAIVAVAVVAVLTLRGDSRSPGTTVATPAAAPATKLRPPVRPRSRNRAEPGLAPALADAFHGRLVVTVVRADGRAATGAEVEARLAAGTTPTPASGRADANGVATLLVPPARYVAIAHTGGEAGFSRPLLVSAYMAEAVTVTIGPAARIAGTALDESGRPLAGVRVAGTVHRQAHDPRGPEHRLRRVATRGTWPVELVLETTTDGQGRWRLPDVPAGGARQVVVSAAGYAGARQTVAAETGDQAVELRLRRAVSAVGVFDEMLSGVPSGVTYAWAEPAGLWVPFCQSGSRTYSAPLVPAESGSLTFLPDRPGSVAPLTMHYDFAGGAVVDLGTLRFPEGRRISGRALRPDGSVARGARVEAFLGRIPRPISSWAQSDATTFHLAGLPAEPVRVRATAGDRLSLFLASLGRTGFVGLVGTMNATAPQDDVVVALEPAPTAFLRFLDARTGQPVAAGGLIVQVDSFESNEAARWQGAADAEAECRVVLDGGAPLPLRVWTATHGPADVTVTPADDGRVLDVRLDRRPE